MDNRYIDPETGKFKDSKKSEIAGGIAGGLAGSLGINALQSYQQYKGDLTDRAELAQELPLMQQDQRQVEQALSDAELLQQIKRDPSLLDQMSPDMRTHFSDVYDVSNRLEGRNNFDKVHELPMKERLKTFIKGKPSLEDVDPELVEYVTGKFGHRPFDPEVTDVLRGQAAGIGQDVSNLTQYLEQQPKFNMKAALPSLDNYRPKKMMSTIMHPLVTGGAMLGVGAGMMADEYRHHLSNIEQRELQKQAGFSNVFKKLMPKKPPTPPGPTPVPKKPLIPKAVKRTGLILGAAGLGGYSMVKAKDDFATGAKMAPSAEKMEGMDQKMNKQAALYAELEKVAFDGGSDEYWSTYADQQNRGPVKRAVDGAHEIGVNVAEGARGLGANISEGASQLAGNVRDAAGNVPTGVRKGLGIGAGVAGAAGLGYGGYEAYNHLQGQEQTAAGLYAELEKVAFDGGSDMEWQAYADQQNRGPVKRVVDGAHDVGVNVAEGARGMIGNVPAGVRKGLGIGAGVAGAAGLGYGGYEAYNHLQGQEQTAAELYEELEKEAFSLNGFKKTVQTVGDSTKNAFSNAGAKARETSGRLGEKIKSGGENAKQGLANAGDKVKASASSAKETLSGSGTKRLEGLSDELSNKGLLEGDLATQLQGNINQSKKKTLKARLGTGAAVGAVGAAGVAGGVAYSKSKQQKEASELYAELQKEAGVGSMLSSAGKGIKESKVGKAVASAGQSMKTGKGRDAVNSVGNSIKNGANVLTGKEGRRIQNVSNDLARQGRLAPNTAQKLQGKADAANKMTANARIGVGAGLGVAGAGYAAGRASDGQQKTASEEEQGQGHPIAMGAAIGTGVGGAVGAGAGAYGTGSLVHTSLHNPDLLGDNATKSLQSFYNHVPDLPIEEANKTLVNLSRVGGGVGGGIMGAGLGLGAGLAGGGIAAALANRGQQQEQVAGTEEENIEKVAHEAINELFGESTQTILNDTIEKIAGYTDPMDRITFSYDNLKK